VIAESVGGDPNNVITVGAHLDSVGTGPGINDNGSGSSAILEIAEEMSGFGPRNPVRFIWFGAEESGLLGSEHYVATLPDAERERIAAMLNFDMIGSTNFVRFVYDGDNSTGEGAVGPEGSDDIEAMFLDYFASQGPSDRADRLRRPLGLRPVHRSRHPGRRPVHRRRGDQDGRAGCDLRRHRGRAVRPVLPRGLRHTPEPE